MSDQNMPTRRNDFYSPFFSNFQKELAQLFDRFREASLFQSNDDFYQNGTMPMPAIDIAETDTGLEVSADIPGVNNDDLDVSVHGETLIIKGEKRSDREEKEKDYHLVERHYGSFQRHIPLGFVPENGAVDADFKNGVLKLSIKRPADMPSDVQKVKIASS